MAKGILIAIFLVVVWLVAVAGFFYLVYPNGEELEINTENIEGINTQSEAQVNPSEDSPQERISKDHLSNPRVQIRNASGDEVAAIDHEGMISGEDLDIDNNATINQNLTVGDTGFFSSIGSGISRVVKGWFQEVDINDTTTITANMTFGDDDYACFGDSGCADSYIYFNGSSLIIKVN